MLEKRLEEFCGKFMPWTQFSWVVIVLKVLTRARRILTDCRKKNSLAVSATHDNGVHSAELVSTIARHLEEATASVLKSAGFIATVVDGSTADYSMHENEAVYMYVHNISARN